MSVALHHRQRRLLPSALLLTLGSLACAGSTHTTEADARGGPARVETEAEAPSPVAADGPPRQRVGRRATGRVVAPSATVEVGLAIPGRVRTIRVRPGQRVEAGDVIATLESAELARAAAESRGLAREIALLRTRRDRARLLVERQIATADVSAMAELALAEAQTKRDVALSLLRTANLSRADRGHLARTGEVLLHAPHAGFVIDVRARVGSAVQADAPIARLASGGEATLVVESAQPVSEAPVVVRAGAEVRHGTLSAGPALDPESGLYLAYYDLDAPLPDGTRVVVEMQETP